MDNYHVLILKIPLNVNLLNKMELVLHKQLLMDFSVILLLPNGLNLGFNYYPADEDHEYEEMNIYLLIVQLKWRFYYE